jgi:hypothetical protein
MLHGPPGPHRIWLTFRFFVVMPLLSNIGHSVELLTHSRVSRHGPDHQATILHVPSAAAGRSGPRAGA